MTTAPFVSVVVPCYNEEATLPVFYERLGAALDPYRTQGVEIVLVDDGSRDGTWEYIRRLGANDPAIVGLKLSRNFGQQMALSCGLDHARGARVMAIDADLQDPPELLADMMAKMDEGFDAVYGRRSRRQGETLFKRISAWLFYRTLNRLSDVPVAQDAGDFRLMSRRLVNALNALPERVRFTRGLVSWLGFKQAGIDYTRQPRHSGKTAYPLRAMLRFASEGITSFSTQPLQLATWLGIGMMLISLLLLLYVLLSWLMYDTVRGWTSLATIFLFSTAMQWLFLGILGNYLAVIFREAKGRPLYLVDEIVNRRA